MRSSIRLLEAVEMTEKQYTTAEAADALRMTRRGLYRHIWAGAIHATKPAGKWLISQSALEEYIQRGCNK